MTSSSPQDCKIAIRPPAPKYAISLAAMEPAAIPVEVNPSAVTMAGVRITVAAPPR